MKEQLVILLYIFAMLIITLSDILDMNIKQYLLVYHLCSTIVQTTKYRLVKRKRKLTCSSILSTDCYERPWLDTYRQWSNSFPPKATANSSSNNKNIVKRQTKALCNDILCCLRALTWAINYHAVILIRYGQSSLCFHVKVVLRIKLHLQKVFLSCRSL